MVGRVGFFLATNPATNPTQSRVIAAFECKRLVGLVTFIKTIWCEKKKLVVVVVKKKKKITL